MDPSRRSAALEITRETSDCVGKALLIVDCASESRVYGRRRGAPFPRARGRQTHRLLLANALTALRDNGVSFGLKYGLV